MNAMLGQEDAMRLLGADLAQGRLAHAYLFVGLPGTGRATLARLLAQAAICTSEPKAPGGCGICQHCRLGAAENHPDLLVLPRDEPTLRVRLFAPRPDSDGERVQMTVNEFLHYTPVLARRRICLVPDAERMAEEAANAFLKTLEEPPAAALILLTAAARDRLLPTIVSRCRVVYVHPLPSATIAAELARRGLAAAERAAEIAALAEGSLGMALTLARSEEAMAEWRWLDGALAEITPAAAVRLAEGLKARAAAAGGESSQRRLAALRLLERLALRLRQGLRRGLPPLSVAAALEAVWRAAEQIAANVPTDLALAGAALETVAALQDGERR